MADRKVTALTELTAPAADDVLPIIDTSESSNSAKNKKIQYTTLLRNLPSGSNTTPSLGWTADSGVTGLYRSAANTLSISINQTLVGSFQSSGLQLIRSYLKIVMQELTLLLILFYIVILPVLLILIV